jgi:hypothetical protein
MQALSTGKINLIVGMPDVKGFLEFVLFILALSGSVLGKPAYAAQMDSFTTADVTVYYEQPLRDAAQEVKELYPAVRRELEASLGLRVDFRPSVILVSDETAFEQIVGSRLIVAYAVPEKQLMVIDYARSSRDPFSMRMILKHELCHLLLHIRIEYLPRWLDEGVCQWVSGGFAELFSEKRESYLRWATLSGSLFRLSELDTHFPRDERGLVLAYEQSRSILDYIVSRFGRNAVMNILAFLREGRTPQEAIVMSLGISLPALEEDWQHSIRTWPVLLAYLIGNIYSLVFFLAAVSTVAGYARYRIRRRRLMEEDEHDPESP